MGWSVWRRTIQTYNLLGLLGVHWQFLSDSKYRLLRFDFQVWYSRWIQILSVNWSSTLRISNSFSVGHVLPDSILPGDEGRTQAFASNFKIYVCQSGSVLIFLVSTLINVSFLSCYKVHQFFFKGEGGLWKDRFIFGILFSGNKC